MKDCCNHCQRRRDAKPQAQMQFRNGIRISKAPLQQQPNQRSKNQEHPPLQPLTSPKFNHMFLIPTAFWTSDREIHFGKTLLKFDSSFACRTRRASIFVKVQGAESGPGSCGLYKIDVLQTAILASDLATSVPVIVATYFSPVGMIM